MCMPLIIKSRLNVSSDVSGLPDRALTEALLLQSGLTSLEMTSMTRRLANLCQVRLQTFPEILTASSCSAMTPEAAWGLTADQVRSYVIMYAASAHPSQPIV